MGALDGERGGTVRTGPGDFIRVIVVLTVILAAIAGVPVTTQAAAESAPVGIYANGDGVVTVLYGNGTTEGLGVGASVVGPMANLDGDRYLEAPFVDGSGTLSVVDRSGETSTLVSGDAKSSKTYLPSGDWDGDGTRAVFYENTSNGKLYRVEVGGTPEPVIGPDGKPLATNGPVGLADYDADGDEDLLFLGSSSTLKYYDGSSVSSTGFSSFGSNNGLGIGAPADFDGDGKPRVPYVTGSANLGLIAADGTKTVLDTNYQEVVKAPVAAGDWAGDDRLEVLHINNVNDNLYYSFLNGTERAITNANGAKLAATPAVGVLPAAAPPAPDISNYSVANPEGRNVTVSFESSEQLVNISVAVDGPQDATLTEADFTESGSGPYRYEATHTVPEDGNYTLTLQVAEDAQGTNGASGEQATVSVQTPTPTVTDVTITDATDGNGIVAGGDTVRVTATVDNQSRLTSVTADASAFGAGTVTLAPAGDGYAASFTVDAANVPDDGNASVAVTATNEYDHSDTGESGTLFVDTTPPAADAGPNVTIEEDTKVVFDGDGSQDNTRIVRYEWTFDDGTTAVNVSVNRTYPDPGQYTVTLAVTDAAGHTATDTVRVNVTDVANDTSDGDTKVVYVSGDSTDSTSDTTDSTDTTSTDTTNSTGTTDVTAITRTTRLVETDVTRLVGGGVRVTATNATAGSVLDASLTTVATPNGSRLLQGIRFVTLRDGPFSLTVRGLSGPPAGVPELSARQGVSSVGYFRINHTIANENVSDVAFTLVVPKDRVGDLSGASTLRLYRYHDGSWRAHEVELAGETADTLRYHVHVPGLSVFGVAVQDSRVRVTGTTLAEESVTVGEPAVVTATLENRGEARGNRTVSLLVNGTAVASREVSLAPNETRTVTFAHGFTDAGTYRLAVEDTAVGTVTVASSDRGAENTGRSNIWSVLLILAMALAVAASGVYWGYRRKG